MNPITARITAITNKITAKSLDNPATPPNPNRLAMSAITAFICPSAGRYYILSQSFLLPL